jgi:uroporphyrinogen decarboxylase
MNSRERYFAAVEGLPVDRVPVCFWRHFTGGKEFGENNVQAHVDFAAETGVDVVKISMDGFFAYPLSSPVKTPADWRRLRPLPKNAPYFLEQRERARRVNDLLAAEHPTLYVVFMPFSTIRHASSDELVMAHIREDPESVLEGMKLIADETLVKMRNVMEYAGCDGMLLSLQGAEEGRFTVDEYLDYIRPFDDIILREAARLSRYNVLHMCGWAGQKNQLACWANLDPGLRLFNWASAVEGLSLEEGKRRFFPRPVMGGFDNRPGRLLHAGGVEEIRRYTRDLLGRTGTRGIVLGPDCSPPEDTPCANMRAVVEAAQDIGSETRGAARINAGF